MANQEATIWGIHGGKTGDADALFLRDNCVAIGWVQMGDLGALDPDREAFREKVAEVYPDKKAGAIPNMAGQLFRFVHEMKPGHIIVYPSKQDRKIHLGRVSGAYRYDANKEPGYPNRRSVKWRRAVPRTRFSQGALYEIGSAMSLFQIRNHAGEFRSALEGQAVARTLIQDDTVAPVAEGIEETTRDFVLKQLDQGVKGHPFEIFVAHLLGIMGYRTRVSPEGADGGIDIIAHKDELGLEPPIIKVEVKSGEGSVGEQVVRALYGNVAAGEFGMVVTLGTFTSSARAFARGKGNLRLLASDELVALVLEHYEQFDARYKRLLPLKRVYVPEPPQEEAE